MKNELIFRHDAFRDLILIEQAREANGATIHKQINNMCRIKDAMQMYVEWYNEGRSNNHWKDYALEHIKKIGKSESLWEEYVIENK